MTYQDVLDAIFAGFIKVKPRIAGKLDRDVRNPTLLLDAAAQLDLLPPKNKLITITGSKGKGSVARLCAQGLQGYGKTALLISPEEMDHPDRMRINGDIISEDAFIRHFQQIRPALPDPTPPSYLSPYGLFLLIALSWFKENKVDHYVIECGRGVRYDEGGQLKSKIGVVTSVFLEHAGYLGPTLEDIRADKMSIAANCDQLIIPQESSSPREGVPNWYSDCHTLAERALTAYLDKTVQLPAYPVASFGQKADLFYEGLISPESADETYLARLVRHYEGKLTFYVSLPDDKNIEGVLNLLKKTGGGIKQVILTGERGFLSYEKARAIGDVCYEGPYNDPARFKEDLTPNEGAAYFIGTQTFLRLVKGTFFL